MHRGTMIYGRRGLGDVRDQRRSRSRCGTSLGKARDAPVYELLGGAPAPAPARLREPAALRDAGDVPRRLPAASSRRASACSSSTRSTWPRSRAAREAVGPRRGADARHQLPVDARRGHRDGAGARAAIACSGWRSRCGRRRTTRASRGVRRGHRDADRAGRERVHRVRLPRDHRASGAADILQPSITKVGGISRVQEDRRAGPGRQPADRAALVLLRARAAATLHVAATFGGAAARRVSDRRAGDAVPGPADPGRATAGWRCRTAPASASRSTRRPCAATRSSRTRPSPSC